jgi:hypothetical protein
VEVGGGGPFRCFYCEFRGIYLALTCDVWVGDPFGLEWWVTVRGFGARTRGEATRGGGGGVGH